MKKFVTYDQKEFQGKLSWIKSRVDHIQFYLELYDQQHKGQRTNMDFSNAEDLLENIDSILESLKEFEINFEVL